MSRKRIKWADLKDKTKIGTCSCDKCNNIGISQVYDWIHGITHYIACDCYYGQQEMLRRKNDRKHWKHS